MSMRVPPAAGVPEKAQVAWRVLSFERTALPPGLAGL